MTSLILTLLYGYAAGAAPMSTDVLGGWRYSGFIYEGRRYPNPNPHLQVDYTFCSSGVSRLRWTRLNESGTCERRATFFYANGVLRQEITWVDPANDSSCATDPDMQPGRQSVDHVEVHGSELHFVLQLKGQPFIYVLEKTEPAILSCQ